jgi:two-component system sensor histidine kinase HydH
MIIKLKKCILDAPSQEAIKNHYTDVGLVCGYVAPVERIDTKIGEKSERLRAIGELAARLAHDLRNPLSVIKNTRNHGIKACLVH